MAASRSSSAKDAVTPVAALARELDDLRVTSGLSCREVARRSGTPVSTVNDALRGRRCPRLATVLAIAEACGDAPDGWRDRWVRLTSDPVDQARDADTPAQLPKDVATFTGRDRLLARLTAYPPPAPVVAVTGPAGAGKTALAVHAAHRLTPWFPDGQVFIDLHGFTKGIAPASSLAALGRLLRSLGVADLDIPDDPHDRVAMFRDTVAGRRLLVVLDNARSAEQVRPLLPEAPGSLVLVTGRTTLTGLTATGDATLVDVGRLPADDALTLLERVVGDRVRHDEGAARDLGVLCDHLPLALRLAGALLVSRPGWSVADLVGGLRRGSRLRVLELPGDENAGLAAAFDVSYQALSDDARRLYRLLSLAPGDEFTLHVAAALLDRDVDDTLAVGTELVGARLVERRGGARYRFHDLLREDAYARCLAEDADREERRKRVLDWYLHSAAATKATIFPGGWAPPLDPYEGSCAPLAFRTDGAAMSWLGAEHENLFSAVHQAAEHGHAGIAWRLASALLGYVQWRRPWDEWIPANQAALGAARRAGDRLGMAVTGNQVGAALWERAEYAAAVTYHEEAIVHAREAGEDVVLLTSTGQLGSSLMLAGHTAEGEARLDEGVALARRLGHTLGESALLGYLGTALLASGRHDEALDAFHGMLAAMRRCAPEDRHACGFATAQVGRAHAARGEHAEAVRWFERALPLARADGIPLYTGQILDWLGESRQATGDLAGARSVWHEAVIVLEESREPAAEEVRAKLVPAAAAHR